MKWKTIATLLIAALILNPEGILSLLATLAGALSPFAAGFAVAYALDIPASALERTMTRRHISRKAARVVSVVLCEVLFLGIVAGTIVFVAPELAGSVAAVQKLLPDYLLDVENWLSGALPDILTVSAGLSLTVSRVAIGIVVSVYMLCGKATLLRQATRTGRALLSDTAYIYAGKLVRIFHGVFRGFVAGKLLEALIVAVLCFGGMLVLGLPYAALIAALVALLNIIPFFGAFIGGAVGALIVYVSSPNSIIIYLIFIVALLQIDAQLIAPRVLGQSLGLRPIWIIFSITVGAELFGFGGMLLGAPVFAVIYACARELVKLRIESGENSVL